MTELLRGGPLAKTLRAQIAEQVRILTESGIKPVMAVVQATSDPSAVEYLRSKEKKAAKLGIELQITSLPEGTTPDTLHQTLRTLSADPTIHGVLLESPLWPGLDFDRALDHIAPEKDVDGLTPTNLGRLAAGREAQALVAATPQACIELAESLGPLEGKRVALVGRGRTVGRPLASMLVNRHATVTVCHTRTRDLPKVLAEAEVIMVGAGRPGLITAEHVRPGQILIDAGINVVGETVVGDIDATSVQSQEIAALTPVPGGVGPLTSAIIFRNLLRAITLQHTAPLPT